MAAEKSPTVRGKRLGIELRRLRRGVELTIEDVAKQLRISESRLSRIETGKAAAQSRDIKKLLDLYGVTDETQRELLLQIAREAQQKGWWTDYEEVLPAGFETYVGLETEAERLRVYATILVPGLLQTEDYARAMIRAMRGELAEEVDELVSLRMRRQERLTGEDPLNLWAVVDEAALRRPIGGHAVMRAQLDHLIESGKLAHVTIQVLPFAKQAHAGLAGPFDIVEFPQPSDQDVVCIDSSGGNVYVEKSRDVRRHKLVFEHLCAMALDPRESASFIESVKRELA